MGKVLEVGRNTPYGEGTRDGLEVRSVQGGLHPLQGIASPVGFGDGVGDAGDEDHPHDLALPYPCSLAQPLDGLVGVVGDGVASDFLRHVA